MSRLAALVLLLSAIMASGASAHALQPGFLDIRAMGGETWRVFWKVPIAGSEMLPIVAVLPETCDPRRPGEMEFDGSAFSTVWVARCPEGLTGGTIRIEGLERTQTDVLVRYETKPGETESQRLTAATTAFTLPEPQGKLGVLSTYFGLGVSHILRGIDHLMFVFALILLIRDRRQLIWSITAFTAAHSISLGAASLGWIVVPAPPVEAVVALSIMFLAAELLQPDRQGGTDLGRRFPWAVAFIFGLVHGLGFARALLDVGLPKGEVPLALFAFNVGVEAGQLMFVALVLVTGALLARLYPVLVRSLTTPHGRGLGVLGYGIGGTAAVWFVQRVAAF